MSKLSLLLGLPLYVQMYEYCTLYYTVYLYIQLQYIHCAVHLYQARGVPGSDVCTLIINVTNGNMLNKADSFVKC